MEGSKEINQAKTILMKQSAPVEEKKARCRKSPFGDLQPVGDEAAE
jgi:hypothetical protein